MYVVTRIDDAVRLEELEEGELFVEPWRVDYEVGDINYHVRRKLDNFYAETLLGTKIEVYPSLLVCRVETAEEKPIDSSRVQF